MNKFACRYAVVQFVPYRETGEFANVGVVLMCPQTGYFDFQLQTRKYKRVTDFFDELPRRIYVGAVQIMRNELQRIAKVIESAPLTDRVEYLRQVFDGLIHPRESMVRFSAPRAVLTDDPAQELIRQYDYYVDRAFATPEYVEHAVEKRLRALLGALDLPQPFRPAKVGDDEVYARFPLVQQRGNSFAKVIKPFNLNQGEPMGIYDHGDAWLQKIRRLRKRNFLPADVLFAVVAPPESDLKRHAAFSEICAEFHSVDVLTVNAENQTRIEGFALS